MKRISVLLAACLVGFGLWAQKYQVPIDDLKKAKLYTDIEQALKKPEQVLRFKFDGSKADNKSLPPELFSLPNLQEIIIVHASLTEIPPQIFQYNNLQILDLSFNNLGSLPENFGELSALKELSLQFCGLSELPESFCRLRHLTQLNLFANKISVLPACVKKFNQLKRVDLRRNGLNEESKRRLQRQFPEINFTF